MKIEVAKGVTTNEGERSVLENEGSSKTESSAPSCMYAEDYRAVGESREG